MKKPQPGDTVTIAKFTNVVPMFLSLVSKPASKQMWVQRSALDRASLLDMEAGVILAGRSEDAEIADVILSIRNNQVPAGEKRAYRIAFPITRMDQERRVVYGLAYCPPLDSAETGEITEQEYSERVDTYGSYMDSATLHALAHAYMEQSRAIDVQHDFRAVGAVPVESYITREATEEYPFVGAWVCGVKINDDAVWARIQSEELGSFSIAVLCSFEPVEVRISSIASREEDMSTSPDPVVDPVVAVASDPVVASAPEPAAIVPDPTPAVRAAGDFSEALAKMLGTFLPERALDCAMYVFQDYVYQAFYGTFYGQTMSLEEGKAEIAAASTELSSFLAGVFQVYADNTAATRSGTPQEQQDAILAFRAELATRVGKKIASARLDKIEGAAALLSEVISEAKDIVVEKSAEDDPMDKRLEEIIARMVALETKVEAIQPVDAEAIRAPLNSQATELTSKVAALATQLAQARKDLDALLDDAPDGTVADRGGDVPEPEPQVRTFTTARGTKMPVSLFTGRR